MANSDRKLETKVLEVWENGKPLNVPLGVNVVSAFYGDPVNRNRGRDLIHNICAGNSYAPTNGAWGDPCYGTRKVLRIEYSEDPKHVRHEVWENEKMQIPENVEIIGARYCDPNNFTKGKDVDVRPGQVVSASNATFGDPCYGIRKKIFVCWKQAEVEAAPEAGSNVTSASELLETIRGFAQLKLQGLLTDEEFTAAKRLALGLDTRKPPAYVASQEGSPGSYTKQ